MIRFSLDEQAFTPVPTVFIRKYMCDAPQDYIGVYLYGLHLAQAGEKLSIVELEERLHLSSAHIEKAIEYWKAKGLVTQNRNGYRFVANPAEPVESPEPASGEEDSPLYRYREFNERLFVVLDRILTPTELDKIYDMMDVFGLPQEVALFAVEHCAKTRGKSVSVDYIHKVAQAWSEEGVDTIEKAKEKIALSGLLMGGSRAVMKQMGLHGKTPGQTELEYYTKWTRDWGFTQESILYAMRDSEFASKQNPFKYLDSVLRDLFEKGKTSSRGISEDREAFADRKEKVKEILTALEFSRTTPLPRHEKYYEKWRAEGYRHEMILAACTQSAKNGTRRFESVDAMLHEWDELGLRDELSIKKHIRSQDETMLRVRQVYESAGIRKALGEAERKMYESFVVEQGMSHETMMYAADISSLKGDPVSYLHKLLNSWADKGVKTLKDAMAQDMSSVQKEQKSKKGFEQRQYSQEERDQKKLAIVNEMERMYEE